jgi:signal transduction histidine kinase
MNAVLAARVLVVEDSATQAEEIRLTLESAGFQVETAAHAQAGLDRLAQSAAFDLVISDIVMPGLSGYDFCSRLKSHVATKRIPVLLLTSLTEPIDVINALEAGADSFLSKPAEPERLIARVNWLLDNRRFRATARTTSGSDILFNGKRFTISSDRQQILDLLVSTFEDTVRKNQELVAARDALAAKHDALLRAERQKEELTALLVHDLKGPAAAIMMAAQSRLKRVTLAEIERELWGQVYAAGEVINRMVLNLLDIARSEDGVFAPRRTEVDVAQVVAEVQQLMAPLAQSRRQQVIAEVTPGLPVLRADRELLRRVLQNLLDNAIRHSPPDTAVGIEAEASNGAISFRVRDQGPGIPPDLRSRIFDKYVQIASARGTEDSFGKGLGLAFCRIAVEAHRGRISIENNEPHGSVFIVKIPLGGA